MKYPYICISYRWQRYSKSFIVDGKDTESLTLILIWISNYTHYEVWDEII